MAKYVPFVLIILFVAIYQTKGFQQHSASTSGWRKGMVVTHHQSMSKNFQRHSSYSTTSPSTSALHARWHDRNPRYGRNEGGFFKRPLYFFSQKKRNLKSFFRSIIQQHTIYVLECENGKYYVGSTSNKRQRFREHMESENSGSVWTRRYKPIKVIREIRRVSKRSHLGMESQVTAEMMMDFGVNNVRGAMFAQPKLYTIADIDALVGFLGHYNGLNYEGVREKLERTLPPAHFGDDSSKFGTNARKKTNAAWKTKKKKKVPSRDRSNMERRVPSRDISSMERRRCHKCGQYGHMAKHCIDCFICGGSGHLSINCPTIKNRININ